MTDQDLAFKAVQATLRFNSAPSPANREKALRLIEAMWEADTDREATLKLCRQRYGPTANRALIIEFYADRSTNQKPFI